MPQVKELIFKDAYIDAARTKFLVRIVAALDFLSITLIRL